MPKYSASKWKSTGVGKTSGGRGLQSGAKKTARQKRREELKNLIKANKTNKINKGFA